MRIGPELQALRGDSISQRQAQAALESARDAWRADPRVAALLVELNDYGEGRSLDGCAMLRSLFERKGRGAEFVAPLVDALVTVLRAHPLGQIPFRHQLSQGLGVLQLALSSRAALSLLIYDESTQAAASPDATLCFSDGERSEVVLAGAADLQMMEIVEDRDVSARIVGTPRRVTAGDVLHFPGFARTKLVERVHGRLVILRLARSPETPQASREFRLSDGALVHRASGDRRESRHEMMMALLGRMRRHDAAPVFAEMTREGSEHLRWQALRECLALDTAIGFAALSRLANDPIDSLRAPAGALRAQLLDAHPQLGQLKDRQCPA